MTFHMISFRLDRKLEEMADGLFSYASKIIGSENLLTLFFLKFKNLLDDYIVNYKIKYLFYYLFIFFFVIEVLFMVLNTYTMFCNTWVEDTLIFCFISDFCFSLFGGEALWRVMDGILGGMLDIVIAVMISSLDFYAGSTPVGYFRTVFLAVILLSISVKEGRDCYYYGLQFFRFTIWKTAKISDNYIGSLICFFIGYYDISIIYVAYWFYVYSLYFESNYGEYLDLRITPRVYAFVSNFSPWYRLLLVLVLVWSILSIYMSTFMFFLTYYFGLYICGLYVVYLWHAFPKRGTRH